MGWVRNGARAGGIEGRRERGGTEGGNGLAHKLIVAGQLAEEIGSHNL